jgi:type I restriction enzyme M protein
VQILNPSPKDLVIDPACGSAGFLFEASRYSWKNYNGFPKSLGIDFSSKSVKVATLLSIATRHNSIAITKSNSLDGRELKGIAPSEWNDFLCQTAGSSTMRAASWGPWNQLGCDVLLTNPPFAGDLDEFDMLDAYESQLDNTGKKTVSREHLFLERSSQLLKPGGRLAIVLPQGVLSNSNASYLRNWLLAKVRILGVIGMHQYAFLPYTSVKTALLFIEKPDLNEVLPSDYPIYFAVSQKSGKDSSGREVGNTDYEDIARSFCQFLLEQKRPWAAQTEQPEVLDIPIEKVMFSEIQRTGRLDAEHYDPIARVIERKVSRLSNQRIGEAIDRKISKFKKQNFQEISYMDISAVDGRTGLLFPETILAEDAPSRASYLVEEGDVLVSTVRPDRNVVALVTSGFESTTVASNGFCVLRGKGIPSELLFAYCKTDAFKKMLTMHSAASMYPTVSDKDIHNIPFLRPPVETEDEVVRMIRDGLQKISDAQAEIKNAISLVDKFLQDEQLKVL